MTNTMPLYGTVHTQEQIQEVTYFDNHCAIQIVEVIGSINLTKFKESEGQFCMLD